MYIKFIKEHDAGIAKGKIANVIPVVGKGMIKEGYAEESTEKEYNSYFEKAKAKAKKDAIEMENEAIKKNAEKAKEKADKKEKVKQD